MFSIAEQFHELYYGSGVWEKTFWLGTETQKCPLDLWIYQEILFQVRPRFITTLNPGGFLKKNSA